MIGPISHVLHLRASLIPVLSLIAILIGPFPASHATAPTLYDVFLGVERNQTIVYFVDARTGLSAPQPANGTKHLLTSRGVLYLDAETGSARLIAPDGQVSNFANAPAIDQDTAIDWVVSQNRAWVSWSITQRQNDQLVSEIFLTGMESGESLSILRTTPTPITGAVPLWVGDDGKSILYANRDQAKPTRGTPALSTLLTAPTGRAFRLEVSTGDTTALPDGDGCPCLMTVSPGGRYFARFEPVQNGGFNVHVWDFAANLSDSLAETPRSANRGGIYSALSQDGRFAVYSVARDATTRRYTLMLADLPAGSQRVLVANVAVNLRPVAITDDNLAALLVGIDRPATYKLSLINGTLVQVSANTWLGSLPVPEN